MELILIALVAAAFGLYRFNKWRHQQASTPGYSRDTRHRVNQLEHQVQDLKHRLAETQTRTTTAEQRLALLEQRVSTL